MPAYHFGAFSPEYPWGWGVSFSQPGVESQTFALPSGQTAQLAAGVRELKLSAARLFFDHRLSLGVSVNLGEAYRSIEFEKDATTGLRNPSIIQETYAIGATLAAQYQLPQRILLGLTLTSPLFFPGDTSMNTADLPSFYQEVWVPWRLGIGVGWIPNRFFQAGFSAHLIGVTPRASRLQDQAVSVGRELTIQPRLGFSYRAIEYPDLIVEASSGTYLEFPRIEGVTGPRPHLTVGFEVKPWIFGVGFAVDYAPDYSNFLLSFGLDVGRMLQKMKLFPPTWSPPAAGVFPEPFRYRAEGLPRPLNPEWKEKHAAPNVFEVVEQIPERMEDKIEEVKDKGLGGVIDTKLRVGQPPPPKRKRGEKPRH
jgi:hypothetical protein